MDRGLLLMDIQDSSGVTTTVWILDLGCPLPAAWQLWTRAQPWKPQGPPRDSTAGNCLGCGYLGGLSHTLPSVVPVKEPSALLLTNILQLF